VAELAAGERLPLHGVRVLDCSRVLAGPYATMVLADLGADVIKLEPPTGDETRTWGPPFWGDPADGRSAYFSAVNRNKRGIVVNLKTPQGRQIFDILAERSDVLVHNFRAPTAERLGLGRDRLVEDHPHLIVSVVGGFPGNGGSRELPAYDLLAQAMSGLMSVTGEPEGEPMKVGVALLDLVAGQNIAIGVLATLLGRADARPRSVSTKLMEVGVTSLLNVLANHLASGKEQTRYGNAHANIAPYQSFRASDGHVIIAVGNDGQFVRLLETLDLRDIEGRFATNPDRLRNRNELADWLAAAIAGRQRDELVAALVAADVPAGPVLSVGEAVDAMQTAHDGQWLQELDGILLAPNPILIDGQRAPARIPPPRFGEHTVEVLEEIGCDDAAIRDYIAAGVVR
jgi:crotonobetainyl-CoA:carnitine CoA-transferase CaiB-like acyl-CoA transferase